MITLIEAKNYRCLNYIRQSLVPFHVFVGPDASGKTTFLDVVSFLGDLVSGGPLAVIGKRTKNFQDLLWWRTGEGFELAVEAVIPKKLKRLLHDPGYETVHYELALQLDQDSQEISIHQEKRPWQLPNERRDAGPITSWLIRWAMTTLAPDFPTLAISRIA
jgi:predicted ATPase